MNDADRRIHPRHTFDRAVFCYHDGTRVDGKPIDISIGGMLFASPDASRVQKGTQMGVVFDRSCGIDPPVYLLGRVVRYQTEPIAGIGLRWLKATTAMEARTLAAFLEVLFGVSATILLPSIEVGQGRMRSVFAFEAFLRSVIERQRAEHSAQRQSDEVLRTLPPARTSLRDPEAGPIGLITRPDEVDALGVEVVPHDQGHSVHRSSTAPRDDDPSVDSDAVAAAHRLRPPEPKPAERPVHGDLPAVFEIGSERLGVRVTQFSPATLFVRTLVGPVDLDGVYPLRLAIPTRDGEAALLATTRISEVRTGRADGVSGLEIVDLDEGAHSGLFSRYLKWLQQSGNHPRG
jgi:hypothetical protein